MNALKDETRHVRSNVRQQDGEIGAAEAAHQIGAWHVLPYRLGNRAHHVIARRIAKAMIDPLETGDVDAYQSHRLYAEGPVHLFGG